MRIMIVRGNRAARRRSALLIVLALALSGLPLTPAAAQRAAAVPAQRAPAAPAQTAPADLALLLYQVQPFIDTSGGVNDGKITSARILNEILIFGTGTNAYYYPAQQPDQEGNVATVYGFSSASNYASVGYNTRRARQATGTMPDESRRIYKGQ
jgi:hypothetical protein